MKEIAGKKALLVPSLISLSNLHSKNVSGAFLTVVLASDFYFLLPSGMV